MASVTLQQVVKHYGDLPALKGLSLDVHEAEFFVIMGPSGAGKTTTLKVIAGIEPITSGSVLLDGADVTGLSPRDRDTAMAFESFSLYPHKTVFENIAFPLRAPRSRLREDQVRERVDAVAALLRIEQVLQRQPDQLSGGQRQRVALARAVVREPHVFLMDEPLSHLDARIRYRMRGELRRLADAVGVTSIYVTHDYVEALGLAERVAVLDHGELLQVDTPRTVFDRPASARVAQLIGQPEINLIEGGLVGSTFVSQDGALSIPLPPPAPGPPACPAGGKLLVGIRPHHVRLAAAPDANGNRGQVVSIEDHITKYLAMVRVGDSLLRVISASELKAQAGDVLRVQVAPHQCLVFDPTTHTLLGTLGGSA
jgi:multiple sugar transport system ATP-binding protein